MVYTLLLYSLSPYGLTDRGTTSLASRGLEEPFFQVVVLYVVSGFGSSGKKVLVVYTTMQLEFHTVVVLCYFFWFWREIVFGVTYALSVQYSCAGVSFFCCGRKVNFVQIFLLNRNFLLVHRKFSSCTYAIIPQKYQELSMQVETCE